MPPAGEADRPSSSQAEPEERRSAFASGHAASSSGGFQPPLPTVLADAASLLEAGPQPRSRPPACTIPASSPDQQAAASERSPLASASASGRMSDPAVAGVAAGHLASRLSEMAVSSDDVALECSVAGDPATDSAEGSVHPEVGAGNSVADVHESTVWGSGSGAAVEGLREGSPCRIGSPLNVRGPLQSQIAKSH